MKIATTRFGEIEITREDIYTFPDGILGFPDVKQYVILNNPKGGPFRWLQAVELASLAFIITDPLLFAPDYRVEVKPEDIESLHIENVEDGFVMVILTVSGGGIPDITANFLGPLIFNPKKMLAKQAVLVGSKHTTRQKLFPQNALDAN